MKNTDKYPTPPPQCALYILLADDGKDTCLLFKETLEEPEFQPQLTTGHNGKQLMRLLTNKSNVFFDPQIR